VGIFPLHRVKLGKEAISLDKTLKTFSPHHPVERKYCPEQDF
jgi:hypothetical protein